MKHGISMEMIDMRNQQPNRNRRECKYYWDEIYTLVSAADFTEVEIPYDPMWSFGGRTGVPLVQENIISKDGSGANYMKRLNSYGIERVTGVHFMPGMFFGATRPEAHDSGVNVESYLGAMGFFGRKAIDLVADMGGDYVTISCAPKIGEVEQAFGEGAEAAAAEILKAIAGAIEDLAEYACGKGVRICIKNQFYSLLRGEKVVDFVKNLKHKVYLDLDTAELKIAGVCPITMIHENPELIGVVHYTDTAFVDDQECYRQLNPEFPKVKASKVYRDLGDGNIHFPAIEKALKEEGYKGAVIVRSRNSYDVCRSILRARSYIKTRLPE